MKLTKILLASTTALGLSMAAAAADTNETYTDQIGDNHQLLITQDGNFNDAGFSGDAVTQRNQFTSLGNTLTIDQDGDNNAIGTGQVLNRGTGVYQFNQSGPGNIASVTQNNAGVAGTVGNEIGTLYQFGRTASATGNELTVRQLGDANEITDIKQERDDTVDGTAAGRLGQIAADIVQDGTNNLITKVLQTGAGNTASAEFVGDNNGRAFTGSAAASGADASSFIQQGLGNVLGMEVNASDTEFGIKQVGNDNSADNILISGNGNKLGVNQNGSNNTLSLAAIAGAGNDVGLTQNGDFSTATLDIGGSFNGGGNNFNGNAESVATANFMTSGLIVQNSSATLAGEGNLVDFTITNGDNNAFAFLQGATGVGGMNNSITGTVEGSLNQVAIAQLGSFNTASFSQVGNGSNLGVSQSGNAVFP